MNTVPSSIKAALEPQVNLLPQEVEARRARGRQRGLIGFAFFVFLLLLAGGVYWASAQESAAKKDLQAAIDEGAALQVEIDAFQDVVDLQTELKNAGDARTFVGAFDIFYSELLFKIVGAMPAGMSVDDLTLTISSVTTVSPQETGPFAVPDVGSIAISGKLSQYASGADVEHVLNSIPGLARSRIATTQRMDDETGVYYTFEGTVRITALAFSGRFGAEWMAGIDVLNALDALITRLAESEAAVTVAEQALDAGEPGAAQAREEAIATLGLREAEYQQLVAIGRLVSAAEDEISELEAAQADGDEGAEPALVRAQERLAEIDPILNELAKAITAWDEEDRDLSTVRARIAAAEEFVANSEEFVAVAEAAVAAGEEGAEDILATSQARLVRAEKELVEEKSYLAAAEELENSTRAALDEALAAAAVVAPVGDVDDKEEP